MAQVGLIAADYLALLLASACAVSVLLRPPSQPKEIVLLALSLTAYAAARGLAGVMQQRAFLIVIGTVIGLGAIITAFAIDPNDPHGKPMIFGYDAGSIQLAMLLALFVFAAVCSKARLTLIAAAVAPPVAILAAAQVRFALLAMVTTLIMGAVIAPAMRRRFAVIVGVIAISIAIGMSARPSMTLQNLGYARDVFVRLAQDNLPKAEAVPSNEVPSPSKEVEPGCDLNIYNSIDMRRELYQEAFAMLPQGGITGIGLGRFAKHSCLKIEVHNTALQLAIEIGYPAAMLFIALVLVVSCSLLPMAPARPDALFALLCVAFAGLTSLASGRLSEDFFLFLMLGYGAGTSVA